MTIKKNEMPRNLRRIAPTAIVLLFVLLFSVGGTLAYLIARTNSLENVFVPAQTGVEIKEQITNNAKTSIVVKNTGENAVYVRVALVFNQKNSSGLIVADGTVLAPDLGTGWVKSTDGYYYYTSKLAAGAFTENLLKTGETIEMDDGQTVTVLAQYIQADGKTSTGVYAVVDAWKSGVSSVTEATGELIIIREVTTTSEGGNS